MCGISACISVKGTDGDRGVVGESVRLLHHRGPDGSNVSVVGNRKGPSVVLGHTLLSIVGRIAACTQPLKWTTGNKRFHLIHNGEIYNYESLRDQLIAEQLCIEKDFKTDGDSEVLLACLSRQGVDWTLGSVRGMFAFVYVESRVTEEDEQVERIILCRDPFGIKPLCYASYCEKIFVCSEFHALPDVGLRDVRDVLPSSFIEITTFETENGEQKFRTRECNYQALREPTKSLVFRDEQLSAIRSSLKEAVSARIPVGVEFAILLSGGLDSSIICRLAADIIHPRILHTFTITASEETSVNSDCHFARLVAQEAQNIVHHTMAFSFEVSYHFLEDCI